MSNYIELGGANNLGPGGSKYNQQVRFPRTHTSDNRFAYALVDATGAYNSAAHASRVQRHFIDFKKPGTTQFVFVYDDVATTQGVQKKTFLHYPNNCQSGEGKTTLSGWTATSTLGDPTCANNTTTTAQMVTRILAPGGANSIAVFTNNPDGTYSGGNGQTFRVSVCASSDGPTCDNGNTAAEFAAVHMIADGGGGTMSAATILSTDANWRGVQVDGASPKVAVFARYGQMYTRATFTSTHAGVAQIAVAGLTPGTYSVAGPAAATMMVGADGVLYLEGTAGQYTISAIGNPSIAARGKSSAAGKAVIH